MRTVKKALRKIVPQRVLDAYHFTLALLGALVYGFPSSKLIVIGVTGTKGKTSTTEMINAIFEEADYTTALLNSIRFKIGEVSEPNTLGRSMPGRFFIQRFLARAVKEGCGVAVLEMTSEGARQYRHRGISLNAFVFTNLAPEHIESHGSFGAYTDAKLELAHQLVRSRKRPRILVVNGDDAQAHRYFALTAEKKIPFSLSEHSPWKADEKGGHFSFGGADIATTLPGEFSLKNALAAAEVAQAFDIPPETIARGLRALATIPGRAENVEAGQDFTVVVDYAHTPDSLKALCDAYGSMRKICILGSAGGGRDTWKRPVMGRIAEENCAEVILTNDDPYDEDPQKILEEIAGGMNTKPYIISDRREAIRRGLMLARRGDVVLITGKGVDPVAGPGETKIPWNDVDVAREEIEFLLRAL